MIAHRLRATERYADTPAHLLPYVVPGLAEALERAEPIRRRASPTRSVEELNELLPPGPIEEHLPCPLCGNERTRILHHRVKRSRGAIAFEYRAGRCTQCQLLRRLPGIKVDCVPELYQGGDYSKFLDGNYLKGRRLLYERTMGSFGSFFEEGNQRRLLDFGSGTGVFVELALQRGFDAYGVDLAADAVETANERLGSVRTWCGSPHEIAPLAEGDFDVVTLWSVLAHFADPIEQLEGLRSLLKPGGVLLVYTVNAQAIELKAYRNGWNAFTRNHLMFWEPATLSMLLRRTGFGSVAFRDFYPGSIELGPWQRADGERRRLARSVQRHHNGNMMRALAINGPASEAPVERAVPV